MSNSETNDFELLDKVDMTLEDKEDTIYKPNKGFFGLRDNTIYPYSSVSDFRGLSPKEIITRRLHLIHPKLDDDNIISSGLNKEQRQSVIRLGMLKKQFETSSKEEQEKMRNIFIKQIDQLKEKKKNEDMAVEQILDQAQSDQAEQLRKKLGLGPTAAAKQNLPSDAEIQARLDKLRGIPPSEAELRERFEKLKSTGGSKRKTSKRKTSKRKTSKRKTSKHKTSKRKTSKRKTSSHKTSSHKTSTKRKSILKRKNKKGKKTLKPKMVSFYL